jgi:hypothetical protein
VDPDGLIQTAWLVAVLAALTVLVHARRGRPGARRLQATG